ncbi:cobalamin B12-binding domain-containing protein [Candidatus Woesearchaeota archaeon]|nr:cobalamin B12-binding domain-containing protein [Candidatus Woesearchaeota archaeon]
MTDKRLLLVNPPFPRKVAGAPLQLLYLAAAFRDAPVEVQILDLNIADEPSRALGERLQTYGPTHVGVTSYSPNYPESLEVMRFIKNFNSGIIVISGGHHETAIGSCAKKPEFIDFRVASTFGENEFLGILGTEKRAFKLSI